MTSVASTYNTDGAPTLSAALLPGQTAAWSASTGFAQSTPHTLVDGEPPRQPFALPELAWLFSPSRRTTVQHCLLLALLLHVWLVLMFGSAPGGTALPGEGVAGTINITLQGPPKTTKSDPDATAPPVPVLATGPTGTATLSRWGGAVRDQAPPELSEPGTARLGQWAATAALPAPQPPTPSVAPLGRVAPAGPLAPLGAVVPPGPASPNPVLQPMPALPAVANPGGALAASPTVKAPLPLPSAPAPAGLTAPVPTLAPAAGRPANLGTVPVPATLPEVAVTAVATAVPPPTPEALRSLSSGLAQLGAPAAPLAPTGQTRPQALPGVAAALPLPATLPATLASVPTPSANGTAPATPASTPVLAPAAAPVASASAAAAVAPAPSTEPAASTPSKPSAPTAPTAPTAATVPRPAAAPAIGLTGAPDAGTRVGQDVATPPSNSASAPKLLNLQLNRPRGGELSRLPSSGVLQLLPRPPELPDKLASDIKKAAKPDCKDAYAGAGLLAVVPLAVDALKKDGGCKW